ncbi:unnamed protein product, partial [Mesorhabditis belari]|uniref:Uncharacterized protein n=1 Tax=Mesorhabditis belari TaxID=2138241 RepID=A0AAF3ESX2_9BILA
MGKFPSLSFLKKKLGESGSDRCGDVELGDKGGEKEGGGFINFDRDLKEKEGPTCLALVVYLEFYVALTIFVFAVVGVSVGANCMPVLLLALVQALIAVPGLVFLFQRIGKLRILFTLLQLMTAICEFAWIFLVFFCAEDDNQSHIPKAIALGVLTLIQVMAVIVSIFFPFRVLHLCQSEKRKATTELSHTHLKTVPMGPGTSQEKKGSVGPPMSNNQVKIGKGASGSIRPQINGGPLLKTTASNSTLNTASGPSASKTVPTERSIEEGNVPKKTLKETPQTQKKPRRYSTSKKELDNVLNNRSKDKSETIARVKQLRENATTKSTSVPILLESTTDASKLERTTSATALSAHDLKTSVNAARSETNMVFNREGHPGATPPQKTNPNAGEPVVSKETSSHVKTPTSGGFTIPPGTITVSPDDKLFELANKIRAQQLNEKTVDENKTPSEARRSPSPTLVTAPTPSSADPVSNLLALAKHSTNDTCKNLIPMPFLM